MLFNDNKMIKKCNIEEVENYRKIFADPDHFDKETSIEMLKK